MSWCIAGVLVVLCQCFSGVLVSVFGGVLVLFRWCFDVLVVS